VSGFLSLGAVQADRPAAERGGIGYPIGVLRLRARIPKTHRRLPEGTLVTGRGIVAANEPVLSTLWVAGNETLRSRSHAKVLGVAHRAFNTSVFFQNVAHLLRAAEANDLQSVLETLCEMDIR